MERVKLKLEHVCKFTAIITESKKVWLEDVSTAAIVLKQALVGMHWLVRSLVVQRNYNE